MQGLRTTAQCPWGQGHSSYIFDLPPRNLESRSIITLVPPHVPLMTIIKDLNTLAQDLRSMASRLRSQHVDNSTSHAALRAEGRADAFEEVELELLRILANDNASRSAQDSRFGRLQVEEVFESLRKGESPSLPSPHFSPRPRPNQYPDSSPSPAPSLSPRPSFPQDEPTLHVPPAPSPSPTSVS